MKKKAFRHLFHMLAFTAVIVFAWPACCCFGSCGDEHRAAIRDQAEDVHGCCPTCPVEHADSFHECSCRSLLSVLQPADFSPENTQGIFRQGHAADALIDISKKVSYSVHEYAALTYTGPPIFILNCVYRC